MPLTTKEKKKRKILLKLSRRKKEFKSLNVHDHHFEYFNFTECDRNINMNRSLVDSMHNWIVPFELNAFSFSKNFSAFARSAFERFKGCDTKQPLSLRKKHSMRWVKACRRAHVFVRFLSEIGRRQIATRESETARVASTSSSWPLQIFGLIATNLNEKIKMLVTSESIYSRHFQSNALTIRN